MQVTKVHSNTGSGMRMSHNGQQIGVMTSDGFLKVMSRSNPSSFIVDQKRHRLPVTCLGFKLDENGSAEYVLSGSPDYTYNIIPCS